jgi:hypothetical protein
VAVKSMQHFSAAFEPIARAVVLVDTGALCSEIYTPELFTKVRRRVWAPRPDPRSARTPTQTRLHSQPPIVLVDCSRSGSQRFNP